MTSLGPLPVVLVDRDGVINESMPHSVRSWSDFHFIPGSAEALAKLTAAGFQVVIVSNQGNVGRGIITHELLEEINGQMLEQLRSKGVAIAGMYVCEHSPEDGCTCRKPAPGLILQAASELEFAVGDAYLIGDYRSDVDAARAAGARSILVLSGRDGRFEQGLSATPDLVVADLARAAEWLVSKFAAPAAASASDGAADLVREIGTADIEPNVVALWWLGQSGFVIRSARTTLLIDPFLTSPPGSNRGYPSVIAPETLDFVDGILGTHDHDDHVDPQTWTKILEASPLAVAIVPAPAVDSVASSGVPADRLVAGVVDSPIRIGDAEVTPFPAAHAATPNDGYGFHLDAEGRYPFVGYLVRLAGVSIYHAGDTIMFEGLEDRLRDAHLDVLMVPINGTSWYRERRDIAGNMNILEAVELADRSNPRFTVPMHYDLVQGNDANPAEFIRQAALHHPNVHPVVLRPGVRLDIQAATR